MAIPKNLFNLIDSIPEGILNNLLKDVDHLIARQTKGLTGKQGFMMLMQSGDKSVFAAIYKILEMPLLAAGCIGGPIGFAVNIIDAIFCFILGNMVGFVIDVISAFCMVPGVKGSLKGGAGITKFLVLLIKENAYLCKSLDVFKSVVSRAIKFKLKPADFIPDLYNFYRNELKCSTEFLNELLGWIYQTHLKAFNAIEQRLKDLASLGKKTTHTSAKQSQTKVLSPIDLKAKYGIEHEAQQIIQREYKVGEFGSVLIRPRLSNL